MMDLELQELCDNLTVVVDKMDFINKLAIHLDFPSEMNANLLVAKNCLLDCRMLVEIKLIQIADSTSAFPESTEEQFKIYNKVGETQYSVKSEENQKNELSDPNEISNDLSENLHLDANDLIENKDIVEAKIEVDECSEDKEVEMVRRKTRRKRGTKTIENKNSIIAIKSAIDPTVESSNSKAEEYKHSDVTDNDIEAQIQDDSNLTCQICGTTRPNKQEFDRHLRNHKRKKKCPSCDLTMCAFELKKHLKEAHSSSKSDSKVIKVACRQCYKTFPKDEIKIHSETCLPVPMQCAVCGKICNGRKSHSDHVRKHKQSLNFKCDLCGRKYPYEKDLIRHKKASHFDNRTCDICGARLKGEQSFREHMELHDENRERSYSCDECGKSFFRAGQLKHHKKCHSDDRPFSCDVCSKSFKYRDNLNKHLRSHNKDMYFKCEECGKTFSFKSALTKHLKRIHQIVFKKFSDYLQNKIGVENE